MRFFALQAVHLGSMNCRKYNRLQDLYMKHSSSSSQGNLNFLQIISSILLR